MPRKRTGTLSLRRDGWYARLTVDTDDGRTLRVWRSLGTHDRQRAAAALASLRAGMPALVPALPEDRLSTAIQKFVASFPGGTDPHAVLDGLLYVVERAVVVSGLDVALIDQQSKKGV